MKIEEYSDFIKLLKKLEIVFKCDFNEEKINLFWGIFKQYKLYVMENAINYLIRFRKVNFEVLPGEIEQAIIDYKENERFLNSIKD